MEPASDADQSCRSFASAVTPPAEVFRFQDGFGNRVHHFNVLGHHEQVRILGGQRRRNASPAARCLRPAGLRYPLDG